jgi:secreted Zn-dependent insulinase-like peptidase
LVILAYQLEPVICPESAPVCAAAVKQAATVLLLSQVASTKAFNQLRTIEALGYIVWLWPEPSIVEEAGGKMVFSIRLLVQSTKRGASYIRSRMTAFMAQLLEMFRGSAHGTRRRLGASADDSITEADIELAKHGLVASLLKRPDSLAKEADRLWQEVVIRRLDWARPWQLAAEVMKLTRRDCAEVLQQAMSPGMKARKAAIEVWRSSDGDPFANSTALHLNDAVAMRNWKETAGDWSSLISKRSISTVS